MTKFEIVGGKLTVNGDRKVAQEKLESFTERYGNIPVAVVSVRYIEQMESYVDELKRKLKFAEQLAIAG